MLEVTEIKPFTSLVAQAASLLFVFLFFSVSWYVLLPKSLADQMDSADVQPAARSTMIPSLRMSMSNVRTSESMRLSKVEWADYLVPRKLSDILQEEEEWVDGSNNDIFSSFKPLHIEASPPSSPPHPRVQRGLNLN